MAQIATSTSNVLGYDTASVQARLRAIRQRLTSDKTLRASDIYELAALYNAGAAHTHTVYDNIYITFGNVRLYNTPADRGTGFLKPKLYRYASAGATVATGGACIPSTGNPLNAIYPAGVVANNPLLVATIQRFIAQINSMRTHNHVITDNYY
jgi:hypothetical protein